MPNNQELQYVDKLNIGVTTINRAKELIKRHIKNICISWANNHMVQKNTFHLIGPAGVGKTQICFQIANELTEELNIKFQVIKLHAPVLTRDDFLIPYPVSENKFKMLLSDFIPVDPKSFGILVIDEFSRADHSLQQLFWQIQNEYSIHTHDIPPGWFTVVTDNPDDSEYSMNTLEDAAGLRRMVHLYIDVSAKEFLDHAKKSNFHPFIIDFIQKYPSYVYDKTSQKRGSVYANPGSYEKLSNELWAYEHALNNDRNALRDNIEQIDQIIYGLLNLNMGQIFIEVVKNKRDVIDPKDIVFEFDKVKNKIESWVLENNNPCLHELIQSVMTFLISERPEITDTIRNNFTNFMVTLPEDMAAMFIHHMGTLNKATDSYRYLAKLSQECAIKNEKYRSIFVRNIRDMSQ
ncbi:MAG: hypothetical protein KatS3mg002_0220 [Candidatus Woesearchaeota archaeon]|nr:MAG: hypothetical protein KatS3mg002_0220 [Candidatus Woesearchaeota archaeon]